MNKQKIGNSMLSKIFISLENKISWMRFYLQLWLYLKNKAPRNNKRLKLALNDE
jgi:hypothetical protein